MKQKTRTAIITMACVLALIASTVTAFGYATSYPPVDENNPTIILWQGYQYHIDDGTQYTIRVTSDDLSSGYLYSEGKCYELSKEYKGRFIPVAENYTHNNPNRYFVYNGKKYLFHTIEEESIGESSFEDPREGQWFYRQHTYELIPMKVPDDVVFHGERSITCYVGDKIMSSKGLTATDNGEDVTCLIEGDPVDTSRPAVYTFSWYITGQSGNEVSFTRKITVKEKSSSVTPSTPAPTAKLITTTATMKGSGMITISGMGNCGKTKKGNLFIKTAKGSQVTLKAKGKKFKYWQKKVNGKYKKYSKKKTIKVKASKNTVYKAVFKR